MNTNDISAQLQAIQNSIQIEIQTSQREANERNDKLMNETLSLSNKMSEFNQRFEHLEKRVECIEREKIIAGDDIELLKSQINELRQKQLELNLVISGLPELKVKSEEKTLQMAQTVFQHLEVNVRSSITSAKRIGKSSLNTPRLIN